MLALSYSRSFDPIFTRARDGLLRDMRESRVVSSVESSLLSYGNVVTVPVAVGSSICHFFVKKKKGAPNMHCQHMHRRVARPSGT